MMQMWWFRTAHISMEKLRENEEEVLLSRARKVAEITHSKAAEIQSISKLDYE